MDNPFAIGGILAVAFAALLAALRKLPEQLLKWLLGKYTVSVEVVDRDESFRWMNVWLANHPDILQSRNLSTVTSVSQDEDEKFSVSLVPAPGLHLIRAFGKRVIVLRVREKSEGLIPQQHESLSFRIFSRDRDLAVRLINEAKRLALAPREGYVNVYLPRWGTWSHAGALRTRPLSTVVFGQSAEIVADIERFYNSELSYLTRGIPFQRGYLFYGPPGNGKTSLVRALAGHFKLNIYLIDLRDSRMSDIDLQWLLASIPRKSILLLEDIDQVVTGKHQPEPSKGDDTKPGEPASEDKGITLSGLLNALDGIVAGDAGRLVFMTTNAPELLPENLIRPGRIDVKVRFPNISRNSIEHAARLFFPNDGRVGDVGTGELPISFAQLQEAFMVSRNAQEALRKLGIGVDPDARSPDRPQPPAVANPPRSGASHRSGCAS